MSPETGTTAQRWHGVVLAGLMLAGCVRAGFDPRADASVPWPEPRSARVGSFSTSSSSVVPVPGAKLTIPPSQQRWLLLLSALLSSTVGGSPYAEVRFLVDGRQRGGGQVIVSSDSWGPWQQLYLTPASATGQVVRVELRSAGGTATIRDLTLVAFPIPPGADLHHAEHEPTQSVPNAAAPYLKLQLTPSSAGRYLVLVSLVANEAPGNGSIGVWLRHGASTWPEATHFKVGRKVWQSLFLARALDLAAGPQTLTLMAAGDEADGSSLRQARLLALRTDALSAYSAVQDLAETTSTGTGLTLKSTLPAAATGGPADTLTIQSMLLRTDQLGPDVLQSVRFGAAGQASLEYLSQQPTNQRHVHTRFLLSRDAVAPAVQSWFGAPQGGAVHAAESVIHRLGLSPAANAAP